MHYKNIVLQVTVKKCVSGLSLKKSPYVLVCDEFKEFYIRYYSIRFIFIITFSE